MPETNDYQALIEQCALWGGFLHIHSHLRILPTEESRSVERASVALHEAAAALAKLVRERDEARAELEKVAAIYGIELIGKSVTCVECGLRKKPIGRSVPLEMANSLCDHECDGYGREPKPGSLWPGEKRSEFGYP